MTVEYGLLNIDERNPITGEDYAGYYRSFQRSDYKAAEINGFFALVKRALDDYYASSRVPEEYRFTFTPKYPKQLAEEELGKTFNFITYRVISREQGPKTKSALGGRREAPFVFDAGQDPVTAGYKLEDTVTFKTNVVRFDIQSTACPFADMVALWFENWFVPSYTAYFQSNGVMRVMFKHRAADLVEDVYRNWVYIRPLFYEVRTQTIGTRSLKTLDSLTHSYEL